MINHIKINKYIIKNAPTLIMAAINNVDNILLTKLSILIDLFIVKAQRIKEAS